MIKLKQSTIKILIVLLVIAGISAIAYLERSDFDFRAFLAGVTTIERVSDNGPEAEESEDFIEKMKQELKVAEEDQGYEQVASQGRFYTETAQAGDGITHLARRAVSDYLNETGRNDITAEQRVFTEDYIQKNTGDYWLSYGETVEFSEDLITEAINKALELDSSQLENLKQFSTNISF